MTPRIDQPVAEWSPSARLAAGELLARAIEPHRERAHAIGVALAPAVGSSGHRYKAYGAHFAASKSTPYVTAFASIEPFLVLLREGDPGAIELSFRLLAPIDAEACVAPAAILLAHDPWRELGSAMGRALGSACSEESFTLLLDHPEVAYLRGGLSRNGYPGGVSRAWEAWRRDRALPEDERAHEMESEPLLEYLLRHDRARAYPELVAVRDEHAVFAAHFFRNDDTEESRAQLQRALDEAAPSKPLSLVARFGLLQRIEADPPRTIEALGGVARLRAPEARGLRIALVDELIDDLFRQKPPRGWANVMVDLPMVLLAAMRDEPKEMARRAKDVWRTLPLPVRKAAEKEEKQHGGVPVKTRPPRSTHPAPDAALRDEMLAIRAALERLVAHLKKDGYRFLWPKNALKKPSAADANAVARLEKKLGPLPPVLAAWWSVVGSVDLRGDHASWSRPATLERPGATEPVWLTDPLVVAPAAQAIRDAMEQHDDAPMPLRIAPDAIGKAGYSGGALTIWLPAAADPVLDAGAPGADVSLLQHVRLALENGGHLGWDAIDERPEPWIARAVEATRTPAKSGGRWR